MADGDDMTPLHGKKPCRACTDFKTWMKGKPGSKQNKENISKSQTSVAASTVDSVEERHVECPLDLTELGRSTWGFLHTMAAYYPDKPSTVQQEDMTHFMGLFSRFFPCDACASHLRETIKEHPPDTRNRHFLSQWMCRIHNVVNKHTGKEEFDCSKVDERWLHGWKDGSCD